MYAGLDVVTVAEEAAQQVALADRKQYEGFMLTVEKFASDKGMIIGGNTATTLLLAADDAKAGPQIKLDSYYFELFSDKAWEYARELAVAIYERDPKGLAHYTTLLTKAPGAEFVIVVDGRELVKIRALQVHKGINISTAVMPSLRPALFNPKIKVMCLGGEIQLMSVYSALCNPSLVSEWGTLLQTEANLRRVFLTEIRSKISKSLVEATGGSSIWSDTRRKFCSAVIWTFGTAGGFVMVGIRSPPANDPLDLGHGSRLHFVSSDSLGEVKAAIGKMAAGMKLSVQFSFDEPKIPTEPRLRRLAVYLLGAPSGKRDAVAYIYNTANYELVPFRTVRFKPDSASASAGEFSVKIGTPFVLMRFWLVELWTAQLLQKMGIINVDYARGLIHAALDGYEQAARDYEEILGQTQEPDAAANKILPLGRSIGRLENPEIALKRMAYEATRRRIAPFQPPFYPAVRSAVQHAVRHAVRHAQLSKPEARDDKASPA